MASPEILLSALAAAMQETYTEAELATVIRPMALLEQGIDT